MPAELPKLLTLLPSSQSSKRCIEPYARRWGSCSKSVEWQKHRDDEVGNVDDLAYAQIDRNTADRIALLLAETAVVLSKPGPRRSQQQIQAHQDGRVRAPVRRVDDDSLDRSY